MEVKYRSIIDEIMALREKADRTCRTIEHITLKWWEADELYSEMKDKGIPSCRRSIHGAELFGIKIKVEEKSHV